MKRCSTSLIISEMEIRTTTRSNCTPKKIVIIKDWQWQHWGVWGRLQALYTAAGNAAGNTATLENGLSVLQMAKHGVITWLSNFTPRYIPKGNENIHPHKTYTRIFTAALFIIAKKYKQLKWSSTDGLKNCGISIQWCIIQTQKRKEALIHATI